MSQVAVYDHQMKKVSQIEMAEFLLPSPVGPASLSEVVRMQQVLKRRGTVSTKKRSEVSGGNKKPYKQKGTGRARQGSTRSPQFVGGGIACGPRPKKYHFDLNRKFRSHAVRSLLTDKIREEKMKVVDSLAISPLKTKNMVELLRRFGMEKGLIVDHENSTIKRGIRNLAHFKYVDAAGLNVFDILKFDQILITRSAVTHLMEKFHAAS